MAEPENSVHQKKKHECADIKCDWSRIDQVLGVILKKAPKIHENCLEIRDASDPQMMGQGTFATCNLPEGTCIGLAAEFSKLNDLAMNLPEFLASPVEYMETKYMNPDVTLPKVNVCIGYFISGDQMVSYTITCRPIKKGEEISTWYGPFYWLMCEKCQVTINNKKREPWMDVYEKKFQKNIYGYGRGRVCGTVKPIHETHSKEMPEFDRFMALEHFLQHSHVWGYL